MIDENLVRAELSPAERAKAMARRRSSICSFTPKRGMGATAEAGNQFATLRSGKIQG